MSSHRYKNIILDSLLLLYIFYLQSDCSRYMRKKMLNEYLLLVYTDCSVLNYTH